MAKDLGRSIDYLETRTDIDRERLAFYGVSSGAFLAPPLLAIEHRFKAAVLQGGGLAFDKPLPEVDPFNFAPRVTLPVLMLNGRYDFVDSAGDVSTAALSPPRDPGEGQAPRPVRVRHCRLSDPRPHEGDPGLAGPVPGAGQVSPAAAPMLLPGESVCINTSKFLCFMHEDHL